MSSEMDFSVDLGTLISVSVVLVGLLVLYFVLLVRALLEMIRLDAPTVMIVFTYISLVPFPLLLTPRVSLGSKRDQGEDAGNGGFDDFHGQADPK